VNSQSDENPPEVTSPDVLRARRIPPGQVSTAKWPVLHAGVVPSVDLATWKFQVTGLVDRPLAWTWQDFQNLPRIRVRADMHCVTRWSRLDNLWEGIPTRAIAELAQVRSECRFVLVHAEQGFTTNLPLSDFLADDCLLAWSHDGQPLSPDHGGPLRLVVPRLYAWKSAKWVNGVEFLAHDTPGYWEQMGYHERGDPWNEERYW
jgi:DMSO/TMAO reductase YedYZ molybdopterin-dependent catalytic subunit